MAGGSNSLFNHSTIKTGADQYWTLHLAGPDLSDVHSSVISWKEWGPMGARVGSCPSHYATSAELINTSELSESCLERCSPVQSTHVIHESLARRAMATLGQYLYI